MSETAVISEAELAKLHSTLDLLHGAVTRIDTAQQQMQTQIDTQAEAVQESARLHDATVHALNKFTECMDAFKTGAQTSRAWEEDDPDP